MVTIKEPGYNDIYIQAIDDLMFTGMKFIFGLYFKDVNELERYVKANIDFETTAFVDLQNTDVKEALKAVGMKEVMSLDRIRVMVHEKWKFVVVKTIIKDIIKYN